MKRSHPIAVCCAARRWSGMSAFGPRISSEELSHESVAVWMNSTSGAGRCCALKAVCRAVGNLIRNPMAVGWSQRRR